MSVVHQVREFLQGSGEPDEQSPGRSQWSSQLFRCDVCGETYISERMDDCPACDTAVEPIPSERDLGFL